MFFVGVEAPTEPIQLIVLADLIRTLVEISMERNFVTVRRQEIDLRRILLDDPTGNEKGEAQIAARELIDEARDRDRWIVPGPGLRRDKVVGRLAVVPI